ncbi:MAG: transcription termination factor NusA [Brevinematia bacterium]
MSVSAYLSEFAKENNISEELASQILREAFLIIYRKKMGKDYNNLEVEIGKKINLYQVKQVSEEITDEVTQIGIEEAKNYTKKKNLNFGDVVYVPVNLEEYGRNLAQILKQVLKQKVVEIHKDIIYNEYKSKVGELVFGKIKSRVERRNPGYYVSIEPKEVEAFLPLENVSPDEEFERGDIIKAILVKVNPSDSTEESQLILSRTTEDFVKQLLIMNIPEISDGTFVIKAMARKPGEVTKIVLFSNNEAIDPVSVTVGKQGLRIKPIRAELGSERLELIRWNDDPKILIKNVITASRVLKNRIPEIYHIDMNWEEKTASVVVPNEFVAPLIGKKGSHQRMLEKLTDWHIVFVPYSEYEVKIAEKQKQIDQILGIAEEEEVEFIEEESIPITMLPFSKKQIKILKNAGFEDVAEIIEYSIEELANKCEISLDEAMEIWKVIEDNVEIEETE